MSKRAPKLIQPRTMTEDRKMVQAMVAHWAPSMRDLNEWKARQRKEIDKMLEEEAKRPPV